MKNIHHFLQTISGNVWYAAILGKHENKKYNKINNENKKHNKINNENKKHNKMKIKNIIK